MNAVFSRGFKADLVREEARYAEISERLSGDFHERVAGLVREVIKWKGGVAQDAQCAGNSQAALNCEGTSGRFIEQHHVGVELLGQMQRGALAGVKRRQCLVRLLRVGMNL